MEYKFFRPWLAETKQIPFVKPTPLLPWTVVLEQLNKIKVPKEKKKQECDYCRAKFGNLNHFKAHIRKHTGEKPFVCEYCSRPFTRKEELTRHFKIHTGEKRFTCFSCGKKFARKDHMKKHVMSMHTRKKPKINNNCEVMFYNVNYSCHKMNYPCFSNRKHSVFDPEIRLKISKRNDLSQNNGFMK